MGQGIRLWPNGQPRQGLWLPRLAPGRFPGSSDTVSCPTGHAGLMTIATIQLGTCPNATERLSLPQGCSLPLSKHRRAWWKPSLEPINSPRPTRTLLCTAAPFPLPQAQYKTLCPSSIPVLSHSGRQDQSGTLIISLPFPIMQPQNQPVRSDPICIPIVQLQHLRIREAAVTGVTTKSPAPTCPGIPRAHTTSGQLLRERAGLESLPSV